MTRSWRALPLLGALLLPLSALAQTTPNVSVFAPAAATATAQAQTAAQATAAPTSGDCPTGNVCVAFGAFKYALDPDCLDQHYILETRTAQDPESGNETVYVKLLTFLKAGADGWIIIPQPENLATGADAGQPQGKRLCAGEAGAK